MIFCKFHSKKLKHIKKYYGVRELRAIMQYSTYKYLGEIVVWYLFFVHYVEYELSENSTLKLVLLC